MPSSVRSSCGFDLLRMNQFHIWIGKCGIVVAHPINLPLSNICPIRHSQASLDLKNTSSSSSDERGAIVLSRRPQSHPDLFRLIIINPRDRSLCLNKTPSIKLAVINGFRGKMLRKNCFCFSLRQFWGFSSYGQRCCKDSNQTTLQQKLWWIDEGRRPHRICGLPFSYSSTFENQAGGLKILLKNGVQKYGGGKIGKSRKSLVHITQPSITFDPPVDDFFKQRSSEQLTVFSGPNNSGKSYLLKNLCKTAGDRSHFFGCSRFFFSEQACNGDREFKLRFPTGGKVFE
jgi:hypothetical protein